MSGVRGGDCGHGSPRHRGLPGHALQQRGVPRAHEEIYESGRHLGGDDGAFQPDGPESGTIVVGDQQRPSGPCVYQLLNLSNDATVAGRSGHILSTFGGFALKAKQLVEFSGEIVCIACPKPQRTTIFVGESGAMVPLLTNAASAPWRPSHAGAGMRPILSFP